jgi:hypothetical protein
MGSLSYKGKSGLTVDLTGQVVDEFSLRDCQDMTFLNGTYIGPAEVLGSQGVRFRRPLSNGDGTFNAFMLRQSTDCEITGGVILYPKCGLKIIECQGVRLAATSLGGLGVDGVNINASQDVVIEDNGFAGSLLSDKHHPDAVQLMAVSLGKPANARIIIRGNDIHGDMQGITAHGSEVPAEGVEIYDNRVNVSRAWGIRLNNASGIVRDNIVRTLPGSRYRAKVGTCAGVERSGNTVGAFGRYAAVID